MGSKKDHSKSEWDFLRFVLECYTLSPELYSILNMHKDRTDSRGGKTYSTCWWEWGKITLQREYEMGDIVESIFENCGIYTFPEHVFSSTWLCSNGDSREVAVVESIENHSHYLLNYCYMLYTGSSHLILIQHLILKIILWEKHHQLNITEKKKED